MIVRNSFLRRITSEVMGLKIKLGLGAMYAFLEGEKINKSSIKLGGTYMKPGDCVCRIGEKDRSSFEMKDGYYLEYVGQVDETLLFRTYGTEGRDIYYAFYYTDENTLLIQSSKTGFWDVSVKKLEIVANPAKAIFNNQISLFGKEG